MRWIRAGGGLQGGRGIGGRWIIGGVEGGESVRGKGEGGGEPVEGEKSGSLIRL